jgi:hypothetical protein
MLVYSVGYTDADYSNIGYTFVVAIRPNGEYEMFCAIVSYFCY